MSSEPIEPVPACVSCRNGGATNNHTCWIGTEPDFEGVLFVNIPLAELERIQAEYRTMAETLAATQARCTALLEEVRDLRARVSQ